MHCALLRTRLNANKLQNLTLYLKKFHKSNGLQKSTIYYAKNLILKSATKH